MSIGYLGQWGDTQRVQNEVVQQRNSKSSTPHNQCVIRLKDHVSGGTADVTRLQGCLVYKDVIEMSIQFF